MARGRGSGGHSRAQARAGAVEATGGPGQGAESQSGHEEEVLVACRLGWGSLPAGPEEGKDIPGTGSCLGKSLEAGGGRHMEVGQERTGLRVWRPGASPWIHCGTRVSGSLSSHLEMGR